MGPESCQGEESPTYQMLQTSTSSIATTGYIHLQTSSISNAYMSVNISQDCIIYLGLGFEFEPQRVRDLDIVCP